MKQTIVATVSILYVVLFSVAAPAFYRECNGAVIVNNNSFESVSYRAQNNESCNWTFTLPNENYEFILILDMFYFDSRSDKNFLMLPDGKQLSHFGDDRINFRNPKPCQIYYNSSQTSFDDNECFQNITRLYCSGNPISPNTWPPQIKTVQSEQNISGSLQLRFGLYYRIIPFPMDNIIPGTNIGCLKPPNNNVIDENEDDNVDDNVDDDTDDDKQQVQEPSKNQENQQLITVIAILTGLLGLVTLAFIIALLNIKKMKKSISSRLLDKNELPISTAEQIKHNYKEISGACISKSAEERHEKQMIDNIIYHST